MIKLKTIINTLSQKKGKIKSDKLISNIFWNSIARFGSAGLNFLMTLFLMSVLDVADYGEFVVFFSIYSTIPFFVDFGLNNSLVSLGAKLKSEDTTIYKDLISTHFSIKAILLIVIVCLSLTAMAFGMWLNSYILMIILGSSLGIWEYFLAIFKSRQEFRFLSRLIPIRNALAFTSTLVLYYIFEINSWDAYLYIIMLTPVLISIVIYVKYFKDIEFKIDRYLLKQTFAASKWIALFTITTAIHAKADVYLLKYFATTERISANEIGIFSAAFSLLALTNVLTSTFAEAILPKVSEEKNHEYFLQFINRLKRTVPFVILFALTLGIILYFVFTFGFQKKYSESVNCMVFIGIGMILTFYIHTLNTIFYPLHRTDMVFKIILVMFAINILSGALLIPILGAAGAAITNMFVSMSGLLFTCFSLTNILQRHGSARIK